MDRLREELNQMQILEDKIREEQMKNE